MDAMFRSPSANVRRCIGKQCRPFTGLLTHQILSVCRDIPAKGYTLTLLTQFQRRRHKSVCRCLLNCVKSQRTRHFGKADSLVSNLQ